MEELTYPGNDEQCWWPGCTEPRIQPSGEDHDTRGWKVCSIHFCRGIHWLWDQLAWPQQPCGSDECELKPKKEVKA